MNNSFGYAYIQSYGHHSAVRGPGRHDTIEITKAGAQRVCARKKAFNSAAKSCKRVLRKARFDHVSRIGAKLASYPPGSKRFWFLSKAVESNFCRPTLPPLQKPDGTLAHSAAEKANLFASLFASNSRLDAGSKLPPTLPQCSSSMQGIAIRQNEVRRALQTLDVNKANGPDGIPARVLKQCAPELSPVLTRLYRLSLQTRVVPKSWKLANVQPVPKKGSRADPCNYRPIAITSMLCKVMERVLNGKLLTYLETNDLLSDRQYGFRRGRSTGDLLAYVTHRCGEAIERNGEALAVSLDISKAFDRVWHASLLSKLPAYGIPADLCSWLSDFLSERSIRVVIDGCSSDLMAIDAGVPQGSVLSATLFLLHINDMLQPSIVGYADDSTVVERYLASAGDSRDDIHSQREAMVERANLTLSRVSQWGDDNLVKFNATKTQACLFSAKRSPFDLTPTFRGASVPITGSLELLGVELSSVLNFGTFIESKAQTAARKLGILNKVKRYFTPGQLLKLYKAQVRSCMEYCSHLWDGSAKYQLAALDSVERRARRMIPLPDTEYDRLPPLFHLDEFDPCLRGPGDRYCYVNARLTANGSNELLNIIQEYSTNHFTHYNHSLLQWGICVTKTCRQHLANNTVHEALEACLNSSLEKTHHLQARIVEDEVYCTEFGETNFIDTGDIIVAIVFIATLALNLLGSFNDFGFVPQKCLISRVLVCFSGKRNWERLTAPPGEGPEPRLQRLKMFNGVKTLTTFLVVYGHSPLVALTAVNNTHFVELNYYNPISLIVFNGSIIVQSFLVISGFLLAFNLLLLEDKVKLTWSKLPMFTMLRWMRLTPPYAAVLAVVATWMRRFGNGPMWKSTVGVEADACRQEWYYHLLYVNDYVVPSKCMEHTWYLAVDMKLTILGLLIFCLPSWRARKVAISVAFIIGVFTQVAHIYFQNLNATVLISPEDVRHYIVDDPTFNYLYKRTHTNIVCYVMGLALGMWIYHLMDTKFDVTKYKKYRFIYWSTIPALLLIVICGGVFYIDGIQVPMVVRLLYSPIVKILFGMLFFIFTTGTVFKLEKVYRGILEWRGWAVLGRLSYCAYLVHLSILRYSVANQTSLMQSSASQMLLTYFGQLVITFILALPCWIMIEAPFNQLVKVCFYPKPRKPKIKEMEKMQFENGQRNEMA
ncbi:uncharacterized protein LOC125234949 [Leguminivora glycinivorella]|uniref:uncharacterized protein LOC125234949 n=1 Tax=Leguminivora glycinivorella TaxID=1035111 RepID=UPI002010460F|nr:uncharacterized protein LOC125234949 [Leguminivora glycinivorella]